MNRIHHFRWPLAAVLVAQTLLCVRLLNANTAFGDEALYLWAGHLELAHLLHGSPVPQFETWFSGAPVLYPVLGAMADSVGGLAAARLLSLGFMLIATLCLYGMTTRLVDRRTALYACALFAVLGPAEDLGVFATYDAMAIALLSCAQQNRR
jgi:4-amino-4-deoxy-L-arabinose transferase-like glycosyltransferase